jgi:hypothetical protein
MSGVIVMVLVANEVGAAFAESELHWSAVLVAQRAGVIAPRAW